MRPTTGDWGSALIDWISGKTAKEYRAKMAQAKADESAAKAELALAQAQIELARAQAAGGAAKKPGATWIKGVPNVAVIGGAALLAVLLLRRQG